MSSASILSSISHYESLLASCKQEILTAEQELAQQQTAYEKFKAKAVSYDAAMAKKRTKVDMVYAHTVKSTLVKKYNEQMETIFSVGTWANKKQNLLAVDAAISGEISESKSKLEALYAQQSSYLGTISSLNAQYQAALQQEHEEALAASRR